MTGLSLVKYFTAAVTVVAVVAAACAIGFTHWWHGAASVGMGCAVLVCGAVVISQRDRAETADDEVVSLEALRRSIRKRALIVGAGAVGRTLASHLDLSGKYEVIGFVDDEPLDTREWDILGTRDQTAEIVRRLHVDEVFLAYAPTWQQQLVDTLAAGGRPVGVNVVPSHYESMLPTSRVRSAGDIALVRLALGHPRGADAAKRAFDLGVSLLALLLLAPLLLLVAGLIALTSRGPVVFSQERVGRFGKLFRVYKFRTMIQNAEELTGPVLSAGRRDSRLTLLGKYLRLFRIDEVPQLWNVIRGEMSLVGPRPERPCFVEEYERDIPTYAQRHNVRPGITGLAQVCGGYHTSARDKLRFDLIYVSHQSVWMDVAILVKTVLVVCSPKGA
jgi:exopolysaccharide biosynthesis polyprenyl glycosylphosphotransferase